MNEKNSDRFIGVDFHVHTPASSCYIGPKTEEEYLEIVRRYYQKDIKIIAITDHNTIDGFRTLNKLKEDLMNKYHFLKYYVDANPDIEKLRNDLVNVESDLNIFDEMLILPGVEFEANPGIHLLLIFDPDFDLYYIDSFLQEAGYTVEARGQEKSIVPSLDVLNVLNKVSSMDAIVIAAHADSDKGIYKDTHGTYRAEVFRSNQLNGISYNNPNARYKMIDMLKNQEYVREEPIAFVQSSDYHGGDLSERVSYLKIDKLNYESVVRALKNPNECVSITKDPNVTAIIQQIMSDPKTIVFKDFSETEEIQKAACALLNEGYGNIVVGASINSIIGVKFKNEDTSFVSELRPILRMENVKCRVFNWGDRKVLAFTFRNSNNNVYYLAESDKAYMFRNKKIVDAKPIDIANLVENRIFKHLEENQKNSYPKFDNLFEQLMMLSKTTIQQVRVLDRITRKTTKLSSARIINWLQIEGINPPEKLAFDFTNFNNGDPSGNVFIVSKVEPRLDYAYLRCSCPVSGSLDVGSLDLPMHNGSSIVLCPGGGSYYIDNDKAWVVISRDGGVPIITIPESSKLKLSLKSLLGWLKSSLLLWYSDIVFGTTNICQPRIIEQLPLPDLVQPELNETIETLVNKILDKEFSFISEYKLLEKQETEQTKLELSNLINEHNYIVNSLAKEIDSVVFKSFGLTDEEQQFIIGYLKLKKMYNLEDRPLRGTSN